MEYYTSTLDVADSMSDQAANHAARGEWGDATFLLEEHLLAEIEYLPLAYENELYVWLQTGAEIAGGMVDVIEGVIDVRGTEGGGL